MRAITLMKVCVASLVLLASIDSNAEMLRLDYKGTLSGFDVPTTSGDFSDITTGDKFQGYMLINTDAPYETLAVPGRINYYSQISSPPGPSPGTPAFVDGSIDIGTHTFSVSAINPAYVQQVIAAVGGYSVGASAVSTDTTKSLILGVDVNVPPTSTSTDLVQNFNLQTDPATAGSIGVLSITYTDSLSGASLVAGGQLEEAALSIVPVPVPASVWLLGSTLLVLCLGAGTRKTSRARQYSFQSPRVALSA